MYLDPKFAFYDEENLTMGLLGDPQDFPLWQIINSVNPGDMEQYAIEPADGVSNNDDVIGYSTSECWEPSPGIQCSIPLGKHLVLFSNGELLSRHQKSK